MTTQKELAMLKEERLPFKAKLWTLKKLVELVSMLFGLLKIQSNRSQSSLQTVLGNTYRGVVGSDRFNTFSLFEGKQHIQRRQLFVECLQNVVKNGQQQARSTWQFCEQARQRQFEDLKFPSLIPTTSIDAT